MATDNILYHVAGADIYTGESHFEGGTCELGTPLKSIHSVQITLRAREEQDERPPTYEKFEQAGAWRLRINCPDNMDGKFSFTITGRF